MKPIQISQYYVVLLKPALLTYNLNPGLAFCPEAQSLHQAAVHTPVSRIHREYQDSLQSELLILVDAGQPGVPTLPRHLPDRRQSGVIHGAGKSGYLPFLHGGTVTVVT